MRKTSWWNHTRLYVQAWHGDTAVYAGLCTSKGARIRLLGFSIPMEWKLHIPGMNSWNLPRPSWFHCSLLHRGPTLKARFSYFASNAWRGKITAATPKSRAARCASHLKPSSTFCKQGRQCPTLLPLLPLRPPIRSSRALFTRVLAGDDDADLLAWS